MRKINPKELLDCLDSLLGRRGGIKGENEVERMADLMKKFSKKLVSKCIYVQILKNTEPRLLSKFMGQGGWELVYQWLIQSIESNNNALIREILELFLACPVDIDHLKLNNCPKVIKALSKDSEIEEIRTLCNKVVEKWLSFVRCGRAAISDVAVEAPAAAPATANPKKTIAIPITIPKSKFAVVSALSTNVIPATIIQKMTNIPVKISTKSNIEIVDVSSGDEWEDGQYAQLGTIEGIEGFQRIQDIQGITEIQGIPGVQGLQGISGIQRIQEVPQMQQMHGFQGIHGLQGVHGIQGFQGIDDIDTIQGIAGVQEVGEVEIGQVEEIGAVEAVETVETLDGMDSIETVESIETIDTVEEDEEDMEAEDDEDDEDMEAEEEEEEIEEQQKMKSGNERKSEIPLTGTLPLYKITVRDGKKVLAQVGTKTLTLPIPQKPEPKTASNTVASLIIKSDPITKQFRYVSSKDKARTSETLRKPFFIREKTQLKSDEKLRVAPMVLIQRLDRRNQGGERLSEYGSFELVKHKSSESLLKPVHVKSHRGDKVKGGHEKSSKTHKNRESYRSDSKHRERDKKERESSKEKKRSERKSHSSDKERSKHRDRESTSTKNKSEHRRKDSHRSRSRDKDEKFKDRNDSKSVDKSQKFSVKTQAEAEKEKDNLERPKPTFSVVCKIPKKSSSLSTGENNETGFPKVIFPKSINSPHTGDKVSKMSVEVKKSGDTKSLSKERPKTVKTYHSKFRLTGLEGEIKPVAGNTLKKKAEEKSSANKSAKKTSSNDDLPPEKKLRISQILAEYKRQKLLQKPGAIKLIPAKPKPALLESDMFSVALTASTKESRKKKRRISTGRERANGRTETITSPEEVKPALKFYRDTLEDDDKSSENKRPRTVSENECNSKIESPNDGGSKLYPNGVLVYKSRQGPKKSVKWKEESELTKIRYFELDENERINVTRNFVDLKLLERNNEREAFQLARKMASDDNMEEQIPWGPLLIVDIPPERVTPIEPGKDSQEKKVQYAREKTVLQAIYFHRNSIPDSPAEPDVEYHITTDPKIIPLDDITGNEDSITSFRNIPWPEPKPVLIPSSPPQTQQIQNTLQPQLQQQQQPQPLQPQPQGLGSGYSTVGNFSGYPSVGMHRMMTPGQSNWRTGDGKDMGINMTFQMEGPMNVPQMNQPPNLFGSHGPDGFNVSGPQMGNYSGGFPMNCDPNMFPPPQIKMGGPPPQWNRNWQGGSSRSGGGGGGSSGSGSGGSSGGQHHPSKYHKGVCHHFSKYGSCARGNSCRFMHPN